MQLKSTFISIDYDFSFLHVLQLLKNVYHPMNMYVTRNFLANRLLPTARTFNFGPMTSF